MSKNKIFQLRLESYNLERLDCFFVTKAVAREEIKRTWLNTPVYKKHERSRYFTLSSNGQILEFDDIVDYMKVKTAWGEYHSC